MFRTIRWRIAIPYILLILVSMLGLSIYLSSFVRDVYLEDLRAQLAAEARLISESLVELPEPDEATDTLNQQARAYADLLDMRVTIIAADGLVLGESHEDRAGMDNHLLRPEVQQALAEGQGSSIRYSRTVGYEMMYVALPMETDGEVIGFVRVALSLQQVEENVAHLRRTILLTALLAAVVAGSLAVYLAERTARPVRRLTEAVQEMAQGDLSARLLPTTQDEVGVLTRTFNTMAERLRETILTLTEERGRLAAVLENMADGALITDDTGHVRLINPAAARIFATDIESALGRSFAEVARDHRIIALWQDCRERCDERSGVITMGRDGLFIQVVVTPLWDAAPGTYLVVLQDLTEVRRLETVRRDFVSNISHELRTPLASLKALTETLRDGALEDPPAAHRFLNRMETEVDALTQMVRELLELSRIESGQVPFDIRPADVEDVILLSVDRLRPQAERAGLELNVELEAGLPPVQADVERMQQVFTNLVHNAIKFTPPGGRVSVHVMYVEDGDTVTRRHGDKETPILSLSPGHLVTWSPCLLISVSDTGVGIPAQDLPRIFERFYKADRARSGGGTGLGLSIAKHIIQSHGGRIWAESTEGRGSTFYVALPISPSNSC
ncbi:MAG: HAMP domain-containing protein [Anaerolineae bacterium]|nr:HAMP domain-containing protein [Anaerolineae bacterium]